LLLGLLWDFQWEIESGLLLGLPWDFQCEIESGLLLGLPWDFQWEIDSGQAQQCSLSQHTRVLFVLWD
jgi:hypothetical protein